MAAAAHVNAAFVPLGVSSFRSSFPVSGAQRRAVSPRPHGMLPAGVKRAAPRVSSSADIFSSSPVDITSVWDAQNAPRSIFGRGPQPNKKPPVPVPTVSFGEVQMDVFSRLAKDRILVLGRQVDDETANQLVAQMLFLSAEDPTKDITLYINSPGGSVSAGLAIFDTMQYIPCDVSTICFGTAASMGAFLLCAGKKGKRKSLPNARIMIHQPLGGAQGQAADIEIQAKEIIFIRSLLNGYIANATGQPVEKVRKDSDRDFFMTPEEAVEYGIIDEVVQTRRALPKPAMPILK
jgi:ATP-dependent Clp endopeptidase proteolytic subunit ClpP